MSSCGLFEDRWKSPIEDVVEDEHLSIGRVAIAAE